MKVGRNNCLEKFHSKYRGGRGDRVSPRVGNYERSEYQKPRGSEERMKSATFTMEFNSYEQVPNNVAQQIIEGKTK